LKNYTLAALVWRWLSGAMPILQAARYFIAQIRRLVTAIIEGVFVFIAFHDLPTNGLGNKRRVA
jgi:hypothetical protein